jgi:hypothetical protein
MNCLIDIYKHENDLLKGFSINIKGLTTIIIISYTLSFINSIISLIYYHTLKTLANLFYSYIL